MDRLHKDPFLTILSFLDVRSFIAMCLVCKRWRSHSIEYITVLPIERRGYRTRSDTNVARLIKEFTCFCGRIGWDVRKGCACWRKCYICRRESPHHVESIIIGNCHCTYGCVNSIYCQFCRKRINQENRGEFRTWRVDSLNYHERWIIILDIVCRDCSVNSGIRLNGQIVFIDPVSKGFIAWKIIGAACRRENPYPICYNNAAYTKIRNKEYIELVRKLLSSEDPDNPLLAFLESFA